MSLRRVEPVLGFVFVSCVLISCCCCSVADEDLEGENGKFMVGSFVKIPPAPGGSEEDMGFEDRDALLAFKKGVVDDPTGALSNWDDQTPFCRWHGIQCQAFLGNLNKVISLQLPSSRLGGSISHRITELSELRHLDLSNNSFSGFIPRELCRLNHLRTLSLSMNKLSSFFDGIFIRDHGRKVKSRPDTDIFESSGCANTPFPELQVLDLSNNFLTGAISEKLGHYSNLREVKLGNNLLMGAIPPSLGSLRSLSILSLENNMLDSSIPLQLSNCRKLQYFDARNNFLSGKVPTELWRLLDLSHLDLTNNFLEELNLSRHEWMDPISTLSANVNFVAKSAVSYSQNLFSRLPSFFSVNLRRAMGRSRRWLIARESNSVPLLFAPAPAPTPLLTYAPASSNVTAATPSPAPISAPKKNRHTARRWALGLIIGFIAGAIAGLFFCFIFNKIRSYWKKPSAPAGPMIFHSQIQPKDLAFLENEETFLGQSTLLGKGASGQVFKACLSNGTLVAIKRIPIRVGVEETEGQPATEVTPPEIAQVRAEIETVGKIRHRNLAWLLAYVIKPDAHLLIYQYMKNGSLHDILHKVREGKMELKWLDRYKIAVSVAEGLRYLHLDCSPRVLHRDIKPSNILLDEDMEAHLGDFGLARLIPDDKSHITTGWAGTVGYIPPEYQQTCRFTEAGDVFSFGITLAVLLTGREPTEETYTDDHGGTIMARLQHHLQAGTLKDVLDPKMGLLNEELENVELAAKVALFCTSDNVSDRPSSKDVLAMLKQIYEKNININA